MFLVKAQTLRSCLCVCMCVCRGLCALRINVRLWNSISVYASVHIDMRLPALLIINVELTLVLQVESCCHNADVTLEV